MTRLQPIYTIIALQILVIVIAIGVGYVFRVDVAQWILTEATREDWAGNQQDILIHSTEDRIVDVIATANQSVVSIIVTKDVPVYEQYLREGFFGFPVPDIRQQGTEKREVGGGSGFIVTDNGLVFTNRHVVSDPDAAYSIITTDGVTHTAEVVARDEVLDIALLRFVDTPSDLSALQFGNSSGLKLGQTVIAIGNALSELQNSVSVGVVSGLARSIVAGDGRGMREQLDGVIQTDAAINPGNSGGPLLNLAGEVIGVNVATTFGADNIGFALPADSVRTVVESVVEHGRIVRPFLGVRYTMVTKRLAEANSIDVSYGALISPGRAANELAVVPGSPADAAGLKPDDIILEVDGEPLQDRSLAQVLRQKTVGQTVTLLVRRDGEEQILSATLEDASQE